MGILIRPIVTEKIANLNEEGKFGFVVKKSANKIEIKKAIEEAYNVNVVSINTINSIGKPKSRYTKSKIISGRSASYKKAIVKLAEGEIIDFYSGI